MTFPNCTQYYQITNKKIVKSGPKDILKGFYNDQP